MESWCAVRVELFAKGREVRRLRALQEKASLQEERKKSAAVGSTIDDVRFSRMVELERRSMMESVESSSSDDDDVNATDVSTSAPRVAVMVRKRPLFDREATRGKQIDVITSLPRRGRLVVHEPKTTVDCSKRVESSVFEFDESFGEDATNDDVVQYRDTMGAGRVPSFTIQNEVGDCRVVVPERTRPGRHSDTRSRRWSRSRSPRRRTHGHDGIRTVHA